MKRWIVVAVAAAALAGVAGGQAATEAKQLKIGMVTDVGGLNDRGFNHLAYVGLLQAQAKLGVKIGVAESRSPADYIPNLASFARQGYDLVLGVGYTEIGAMGAVAKRFPKTHFAIVDVANGDLAGQAEERARTAFPRGAGRVPRRLPRGARGQAASGRATSCRLSQARSSRPSTGSSPATRQARSAPTRA